MEVVRLIRISEWIEKEQRFGSPGFSVSNSDGGISVIKCSCVAERNAPICKHIRDFYQKSTTGDPPVYWKFDTDIIPESIELKQKTTDSGDVCHFNITGISQNKARKFFKKIQLGKNKDSALFAEIMNQGLVFKICEPDNNSRVLVQFDIE